MPEIRSAIWLRILTHERGVVLWLPGLLLAAWVLLFAIHLAPGGTSLFTHTTGFRIVVGPWRCDGDCGDGAARVRQALESRLRTHGDVTLVDPARVAQRLAATGAAAGDDPMQLVHALRPFNAQLALEGTVERTSAGFAAQLRATDARDGRRVFERTAAGSDPAELGAAFADSVRQFAFGPAGAASRVP